MNLHNLFQRKPLMAKGRVTNMKLRLAFLFALLTLFLTSCAFGVVRDTQTGVPIQGAAVVFQDSQGKIGEVAAGTSGLYTFDGFFTAQPIPGQTTFWISAPGYVPLTTQAIVAYDEHGNWTQDFSLEKSSAVRIYGLNFSPYMDGQNPNQGSTISEAQLRTRMAIIAPYTEWIRTFSCSAGLEKAGVVAHELGLKAAIGAWLSKDLAANEREINCLISLAQTGQADMAIVGSEVLLRGDLSESQLIGYINRVEQAAPGLPVATADVYGELLDHSSVMAAGDVVLANFYPYWEGIGTEQALDSLSSQYQRLVSKAGGKQVLVSETGWPSGGDSLGKAIPSPENASSFFASFVSWAKSQGVDYFYFEAFDETWKAASEGPQGAHWGIWDKNGSMKTGMERVFQ